MGDIIIDIDDILDEDDDDIFDAIDDVDITNDIGTIDDITDDERIPVLSFVVAVRVFGGLPMYVGPFHELRSAQAWVRDHPGLEASVSVVASPGSLNRSFPGGLKP